MSFILLERWRQLLKNWKRIIIPENFLAFLISLFSPCGDTTETIFERCLFVFLLTFVIVTFLVPGFAFIFFSTENKIDALDATCAVAPSMLYLIKHGLCIWQQGHLRLLINRLQIEWNKNSKATDQEVVDVLELTKRLCRKIFFSYMFWFGLMAVFYLFLPILRITFYWVFNAFPANFQPHLPLKLLFPYDIHAGYNFGITYAIVLLDILYISLILISLDTLFVSIVCHVTAQFKLLNIQIAELKKLPKDKLNRVIDMNSSLIKCIQQHEQCIQLVNEVEKTFNLSVFMHCLSSSVILCLILFVSLSLIDDVTLAIKPILYFLGELSQLFLYCWISEGLNTEIKQMVDTVYDLPWYLYPKSEQKMVLMMILRGQRPLGITAATFYIISIESFQKVLSTAYSYFALLSSVLETT